MSRRKGKRRRKKKIRIAALIRCGELCRSCPRVCSGLDPNEQLDMECVSCEGSGTIGTNKCDECNGTGFFTLTECPQKLLGSELVEDINLASYAEKGHLPEHGGMLNQEAWFVSLWGTLASDESRIEQDKRERR